MADSTQVPRPLWVLVSERLQHIAYGRLVGFQATGKSAPVMRSSNVLSRATLRAHLVDIGGRLAWHGA